MAWLAATATTLDTPTHDTPNESTWVWVSHHRVYIIGAASGYIIAWVR